MHTQHGPEIGWNTDAAKPLAPQALAAAAKRPTGGQRVPSAGVGVGGGFRQTGAAEAANALPSQSRG